MADELSNRGLQDDFYVELASRIYRNLVREAAIMPEMNTDVEIARKSARDAFLLAYAFRDVYNEIGASGDVDTWRTGQGHQTR